MTNEISVLGWSDKAKDDPSVIQLTAHLENNNGIKGLEIFHPKDIESAVSLSQRRFCNHQ